MKKDIVIYGAGGLARETHWMINSNDVLRERYNVRAFVVDSEYIEKTPREIADLPVISKDYFYNDAKRDKPGVIIAIGEPRGRRRCFEELELLEYLSLPSIVHPTCNAAPDIEVGAGTIIHSYCIVTVGAKIGKCVFVNGTSAIGHDAEVGDFVSIMPRCDISGHVKIGACASIGAKSFILERKSVGENAVVAPGSIVLRNVPANVTVMGNPAKVYLTH